MNSFNITSFLVRLFFALVLVFATYNPTEMSYLHWLIATLPGFTPVVGLTGLVILVGWIIFLRASMRSIGILGFVIVALFVSCFIWLFIDLGWLSLTNVSLMSWIIEIGLALVLAVGLSWSHIRRRLSGQVDIDDVED